MGIYFLFLRIFIVLVRLNTLNIAHITFHTQQYIPVQMNLKVVRKKE